MNVDELGGKEDEGGWKNGDAWFLYHQVGCLHNGVEGLNYTRVPSVSDRLWPIIVCVLGAFIPNSGLSYILEREPCGDAISAGALVVHFEQD